MIELQNKQLTLISHKLCPYVQRAVAALEELNIDYKRIDIDLNNKPSWFKKLSPTSKVPILVVDDNSVLFESAVIAEYINDIAGNALLSSKPLAKAKQRAWIEFASNMLQNIGKLYSAGNKTLYLEVFNQLDAQFKILEQNISSQGYFDDSGFTLVDIAFAPIFRYASVFNDILSLELLGEYKKVVIWSENLIKRKSIESAVTPEYSKLLFAFLCKKDSYLGELSKQYQSRLIEA
ncbi:glutathione S-transferase family protein [Pseudoalteromonas denitrificans]|uniref:Glutathione S-transferase n=1 Tax=Pseudoalteromonas denitrificans DSM 6059 TaxID=1123010 RepID=A0A1I1LTE7_9GAMM|nr:glutathione S-transferase family protein [Pseudoalteromonas denitrificans]SFC74208.1 glutathione S-transferase [Pseudoalteromonas denitrificans DSM 6059]